MARWKAIIFALLVLAPNAFGETARALVLAAGLGPRHDRAAPALWEEGTTPEEATLTILETGEKVSYRDRHARVLNELLKKPEARWGFLTGSQGHVQAEIVDITVHVRPVPYIDVSAYYDDFRAGHSTPIPPHDRELLENRPITHLTELPKDLGDPAEQLLGVRDAEGNIVPVVALAPVGEDKALVVPVRGYRTTPDGGYAPDAVELRVLLSDEAKAVNGVADPFAVGLTVPLASLHTAKSAIAWRHWVKDYKARGAESLRDFAEWQRIPVPHEVAARGLTTQYLNHLYEDQRVYRPAREQRWLFHSLMNAALAEMSLRQKREPSLPRPGKLARCAAWVRGLDARPGRLTRLR